MYQVYVANIPASEHPTIRIDATAMHPRIRLKDSWLQILYTLTDVHDRGSTAADQFEFLHAQSNVPPISIRNLPFEDLWKAFFDFKASINELTTGPHLDDPTAYNRPTTLHDDINALHTQVRALLALSPPNLIAHDYNTLESLHTLGLRVHAQINAGFTRLLAARLDFDDAHAAAEPPIDITSFTKPYTGPPVLCTICQEPACSSSGALEALQLPCPAAHVFHTPCLASLANSASACNNRCPNCRHVLPFPSSRRRPDRRVPRFSEVGARSAVHTVWQGVREFMEMKRVSALVFGEPAGVEWLRERGWAGWETVRVKKARERGNRLVRGREGGSWRGRRFVEGVFVGGYEDDGRIERMDSVVGDEEFLEAPRSARRVIGYVEGPGGLVPVTSIVPIRPVEAVDGMEVERASPNMVEDNRLAGVDRVAVTDMLADVEAMQNVLHGDNEDGMEDRMDMGVVEDVLENAVETVVENVAEDAEDITDKKVIGNVEELEEMEEPEGVTDVTTPARRVIKSFKREYALGVLFLLIAGLTLAEGYVHSLCL
ncbi:uncharacterized protein BDZ99DRAFT_565461 [Mytilinidion resinicola]|uniref:RING-type domain-containing protein n=1 Tax=Mytilinidion resinicola TaxID=574789 RepID=A0A6A6Z9G0_9PEZI|nr:uncharacterized protein BDZ99DRAFT_565461 [Mytilinidion resinicola]KAF2817761.1 hypothetical protein BDZ99DRAFT_565461 [Mytilinidion resinicola]